MAQRSRALGLSLQAVAQAAVGETDAPTAGRAGEAVVRLGRGLKPSDIPSRADVRECHHRCGDRLGGSDQCGDEMLAIAHDAVVRCSWMTSPHRTAVRSGGPEPSGR